MISKKLEKAINAQINAELYSAYLYLSMAAYADNESLSGFANWFKKQSSEELEHAQKFYEYLSDRGGCIALEAIDAPQAEFESPLDVFEKTLEHEKHVTRLINDLYSLALEEGDVAAQVELHWFIAEQVEEEKNASDVIALLERAGNKGHAMLMIDRVLAER